MWIGTQRWPHFFSVWQEVARLLDFDTLRPRLDANSLQIVDETHHASRFLGEVESDWWMGRLWSILSNLFGPAYCNPKSPANLGTRTPCWLPVRMVVWRVPWSHVLRRLLSVEEGEVRSHKPGDAGRDANLGTGWKRWCSAGWKRLAIHRLQFVGQVFGPYTLLHFSYLVS